MCSSIRELSVPVAEVQPVTETPRSVQRGVSGPAAVVMPQSALGPTSKRDTPEVDRLSEDETKNNCYLCSLNGRPLAECCIEVPGTIGSKPAQFTLGHSRRRKQVVCKWFDEKFSEDDVERKAKLEHAQKARANALKLFSKKKPRKEK